ncbi:MAG: Xaa-Pro peptidase family protein [Lentisphaeria bacterium]|nr:Xaa-Pro peptidase family protein [Lentisphaeria bacterium]
MTEKILMEKYDGESSLEEVLRRCQKSFQDYTGRDLLFSRDVTKEEFRARRGRLAELIGADAHILILGGPAQASHLASQDATFYYFTGLDALQSYLLIDGHDGHSTLFLPPRDAMDGDPWDKVGFEDADMVGERLGVDTVKAADQLTSALGAVKRLYIPFAELEGGGVTRFLANGCAKTRASDPWDGTTPRHQTVIEKLKNEFPAMTVEDASPFIGRMRRVKSPAEIEVLRQAGHLSALIMIESMKATRPGMCESQLEAIAKYIYSAYGNCDLGYGVIAASGVRIENGHYHFNNCTLKDGDVVLMDCGPDLRHYSSDIARIWPVNGRYSDWHRRVYGLIVEYHKVLISLIKPGIFAQDAYAEARAIVRRDYVKEFFPNGDLYEPLDSMLSRGGPYNHCVGLSVHDFVGPWRDEVIEEGMVFVVDPMAMFRDLHQYIRVEDTVVVTRDGCERLTGAAPIEMDDIEELMTCPGAFDPENLRIFS